VHVCFVPEADIGDCNLLQDHYEAICDSAMPIDSAAVDLEEVHTPQRKG